MEKQVSSEEKLLKLIRKGDSKQKFKKADSVKQESQPFRSSELSSAHPGRLGLLKFVNRLLLLIAVIIGGYIVYSYFFVQETAFRATSLQRESSQQDAAVMEIEFPESDEFSFYESNLSERNLFESPWEKPKSAIKATKSNTSALDALVMVVGIVVDENPTVIVEDLKTKQTVFLSKGESIFSAEVLDISEDRVIFRYNDEEIELTP